MTWTAYGYPAEVIPNDDLRTHSEGSKCWCNPSYDAEVLVHNSMDKREEYERGERLMS